MQCYSIPFAEIPLPSTPSKQVTHTTVESRESKYSISRKSGWKCWWKVGKCGECFVFALNTSSVERESHTTHTLANSGRNTGYGEPQTKLRK